MLGLAELLKERGKTKPEAVNSESARNCRQLIRLRARRMEFPPRSLVLLVFQGRVSKEETGGKNALKLETSILRNRYISLHTLRVIK